MRKGIARTLWLAAVLLWNIITPQSALAAAFIDFENVPGGNTDQMTINTQYSSLYGIEFWFGNSSHPQLAQVGSPMTAFRGPYLTNAPDCGVTTDDYADMPRSADQAAVGCWFLTDDDAVVSGLPAGELIVKYLPSYWTTLPKQASGVMLDIDGAEVWVVKAYRNNVQVGTSSGPYTAPPGGGDGAAVPWSIDVSPSDFDELRISYDDATPRNVGWAVDNLCLDPLGCAISGMVFLDQDKSGCPSGGICAPDPGEPAVAGELVYLTDASGVVTPLPTALDGSYAFMGLPPGRYTVHIDPVSSYLVQTCPTTVYYTVELQAGDHVTDRNFGIYPCETDLRCYHTELHGTDDNFDGPEWSDKNQGLDDKLNEFYDRQDYFDSVTDNQCFGHSFTFSTFDIPEDCVVMAAEICLHLHASGCIPTTDWLVFGDWNPGQPGTIWRMSMNDVINWHTNGSDVSWDYCDEMVVCFDLANLPSSITAPNVTSNILAALQDGELDILIQDDTEVDYIKMTLELCCLPCEEYATGDMDGDGIPLTTADLVLLGQFVRFTAPWPANIDLWQGDLTGDCRIDELDVEILQSYFASGIGVFPQWPVPTCCCPDTTRGACCTEESDGQMLTHVCDVLHPNNCAMRYGDYLGDWIPCTGGACPRIHCRMRGDINHDDNGPDIADLLYLVEYMFNNGPAPPYPQEADVDGDGNEINIGDLLYLVEYMFNFGPELVPCEDSTLVGSKPIGVNPEISLTPAYEDGHTIVSVNTPVALRGIQLELKGKGEAEPVNLAGDHLDLVFGRKGETFKIGLLDLDGAEVLPAGNSRIIRLEGEYSLASALVADMSLRAVRPTINGSPKGAALPKDFALNQNYPNPFNPTTRISFSLPQATDTRLEIFNIVGQKVATLVDGRLDAGVHTVKWDGRETASGVYFYRLTTEHFVDTKQMVLLK